jgi:hypothetical protein
MNILANLMRLVIVLSVSALVSLVICLGIIFALDGTGLVSAVNWFGLFVLTFWVVSVWLARMQSNRDSNARHSQ